MFKHTILVIDDDPLILDTLAKRLATWQIDVQRAGDPEKAKELASKYHPEVVLLDLLLTKNDGAQSVIDFMKGDPALVNTPILALTNLDKPELRDFMLSQGVNEYLIKGSMSLDDIYNKVLSYLEPEKIS